VNLNSADSQLLGAAVGQLQRGARSGHWQLALGPSPGPATPASEGQLVEVLTVLWRSPTGVG
jgi:hypothetical protein